jgi:hypothetical protein
MRPVHTPSLERLIDHMPEHITTEQLDLIARHAYAPASPPAPPWDEAPPHVHHAVLEAALGIVNAIRAVGGHITWSPGPGPVVVQHPTRMEVTWPQGRDRFPCSPELVEGWADLVNTLRDELARRDAPPRCESRVAWEGGGVLQCEHPAGHDPITVPGAGIYDHGDFQADTYWDNVEAIRLPAVVHHTMTGTTSHPRIAERPQPAECGVRSPDYPDEPGCSLAPGHGPVIHALDGVPGGVVYDHARPEDGAWWGTIRAPGRFQEPLSAVLPPGLPDDVRQAAQTVAEAVWGVSTTRTPIVQHGPGEGSPQVAGQCPSCRGSSLFLGAGGHVTCSRLDCPNPAAADDLLTRGHTRWSWPK